MREKIEQAMAFLEEEYAVDDMPSNIYEAWAILNDLTTE